MVFSLPDFMASPDKKKSDSQRPRPLHLSKSFSRVDPPSPDHSTRVSRASTIQNGVIPEVVMADKTNVVIHNGNAKRQPDAFEKASEEDEDHETADEGSGKLPDDFDELPIELVSLSDSFIDSLSAKVHPTPPSVDKLSALFQDFYTVAATHISTHISALSSRQHRESSPAPSVTSRLRAKAASIGNKDRPKIPPERRDSEQMLTVEEIAERKRARKVLERKRIALEEAVERRVTEGIYDRIWRHRSTQDEAQDEKLRSKTAALSVVGIGLTDLGIDLGQNEEESSEDKEKEIREWLEDAREDLIAMNDKKYPLGKLQHLKAAHKNIVETLSHFHPSSSADEIMPMLIYTLITSRPEGIDVISNLYFIQRFRNESKIDGEAAYCLTNLEAAITFLETVDLASLREDEVPSGPPKAVTPRVDSFDQMQVGISPPLAASVAEVTSANASLTISKAESSPSSTLRPQLQVHNRRLSDMFQPPAVLNDASDAVMKATDQSFKSIGNSLGDSYKFLLGKLKERQDDSPGHKPDIIVPKTLDDARKLVSTPPPEDAESESGASSLHTPDKSENRQRADSGAKVDDKMLSMISGRKLARDRSADSARSSGSGSTRRVTFTEEGEKAPSPLHNAAPAPSPSGTPALVDSMRNLGNSLNPMTRIAGMGMMRGFGRTTPTSPVPPPPAPSKGIPDGGVAELSTAFPELAPSLPPKEIPKIAPPIKRFMELQNPGDMRLNEVLELLRDYRRLAGALKDLGAV
ncbi:related to VPS9 [Phialocephala subalpina]|uniref:Related to VPS9 n=1 Tax=Phialocephala subalpina TaxID=576137 RepID=A0A1L7X2P5_9HELO|nr:related to VPS9 [Phialocephala subalpina]